MGYLTNKNFRHNGVFPIWHFYCNIVDYETFLINNRLFNDKINLAYCILPFTLKIPYPVQWLIQTGLRITVRTTGVLHETFFSPPLCPALFHQYALQPAT